MATDVVICNLALSRVGVKQAVASLNENNDTARTCNRFYDHCRETMLREYPWPWAERPVALALVANNPVDDWMFAYRYPQHALRVNRIIGGVRRPESPLIYRLGSDSQGKLIYTDYENPTVWVNWNITDTSMFDSLFTDALAWRIASEIAPILSTDSAFAERVAGRYELAVRRALASALNEEGQEENPCSFIEAYN
jgi:hypothetical protein